MYALNTCEVTQSEAANGVTCSAHKCVECSIRTLYTQQYLKLTLYTSLPPQGSYKDASCGFPFSGPWNPYHFPSAQPSQQQWELEESRPCLFLGRAVRAVLQAGCTRRTCVRTETSHSRDVRSRCEPRLLCWPQSRKASVKAHEF